MWCLLLLFFLVFIFRWVLTLTVSKNVLWHFQRRRRLMGIVLFSRRAVLFFHHFGVRRHFSVFRQLTRSSGSQSEGFPSYFRHLLHIRHDNRSTLSRIHSFTTPAGLETCDTSYECLLTEPGTPLKQTGGTSWPGVVLVGNFSGSYFRLQPISARNVLWEARTDWFVNLTHGTTTKCSHSHMTNSPVSQRRRLSFSASFFPPKSCTCFVRCE